MTGKAGYSLFEVLIAFAIMTMVLSVMLPGQAQLVKRAKEQDQLLLAHDYALSRLAHIGISEPIDLGRWEETYRDWEVQISVEQGDPFQVLEVSVFNKNGAQLAAVSTVRAHR